MPLELVLLGPRKIGFREYAERPLEPHEVRVKSVIDAISHGTEMKAYRAEEPKRYDPNLHLFIEAETSQVFPQRLGGGGVVGRVIEIGKEVESLDTDDTVWLPGGHRETVVASESVAKTGLLSEGITPETAVAGTWLARVALNGVRDALIGPGDIVSVFGLGVVGLLTVQLAQLSGALEVYAIDRYDMRLKKAEEYGATTLDTSHIVDPGLEIKRRTNGLGVDVAIEASGSYWCLHQAIRSCMNAGRIVTLGNYTGGGSNLFLGEEWHLNYISCMISSRGFLSRSPGWDSTRVTTTIMELFKKKKLRAADLITHRIPFPEAEKAYRILDEKTGETIKVCLDYSSTRHS